MDVAISMEKLRQLEIVVGKRPYINDQTNQTEAWAHIAKPDDPRPMFNKENHD